MERKSRILENIAILGVGIVLICLYGNKDLFRWIITLVGVMFILPAVIGMVGQANQDRRAREEAVLTGRRRRGRMNSLMSWVTCIGGVILGVVFIVWWEQFKTILAFLMGMMVLGGGVYHFYMLAVGYGKVKFPVWAYVFPALLIIGGGILLFAKPQEDTTAMITGIGMIVFAVASFLEVTIANMSAKGGDSDDTSRAVGQGASNAVARRNDDYFVGDDDKYTQDVDPE